MAWALSQDGVGRRVRRKLWGSPPTSLKSHPAKFTVLHTCSTQTLVGVCQAQPSPPHPELSLVLSPFSPRAGWSFLVSLVHPECGKMLNVWLSRQWVVHPDTPIPCWKSCHQWPLLWVSLAAVTMAADYFKILTVYLNSGLPCSPIQFLLSYICYILLVYWVSHRQRSLRDAPSRLFSSHLILVTY